VSKTPSLTGTVLFAIVVAMLVAPFARAIGILPSILLVLGMVALFRFWPVKYREGCLRCGKQAIMHSDLCIECRIKPAG
jgi:hypothetical protein